MEQDATKSNTNLKREFNRFINRFFFSKERTVKNLAYLYYLIEDMLRFLENEEVKIGNELLEKGFKKEYIQDFGLKLWLDEECGILWDTMTSKEKEEVSLQQNKEYIESQTKGTM